MKIRSIKSQKGATLIIGLIMLILLTLMAVTSFNLGKSNMQVVGNMQFRNETVRAAETRIEAAVSSPLGTTVASTATVDVNGDGKALVNVTVTPTIVQAYIKKNGAINIYDPGQSGCGVGTNQGGFAIEGTSSNNSLCASALYDLKVVATEATTSTSVELHQGVAIQVPTDNVCKLVTCS